MNIVLIIISSLVYFTLVGFELLDEWHPIVALIVFILVPSLAYWCLISLILKRKRRKISTNQFSKLSGEEPSPQEVPSSPTTDMDKELAEAYEILGLPITADQEEVLEAHRRLIRHNHPDKGGSTHLAKLINEAKTVLMKHFSESSPS